MLIAAASTELSKWVLFVVVAVWFESHSYSLCDALSLDTKKWIFLAKTMLGG